MRIVLKLIVALLKARFSNRKTTEFKLKYESGKRIVSVEFWRF